MRYSMIINLHDCVGCGCCDIACAQENQVPAGVHLGYHLSEMSGAFPKVSYTYRPVMCNHCANAACVKACPTAAMHKDANGLTVVDVAACTQCGKEKGHVLPVHAVRTLRQGVSVRGDHPGACRDGG